jgi:hypothetical protein
VPSKCKPWKHYASALQQELRAEVFGQEPPAQALQQHPELAPAYAYVRATEAKAVADGLNEQQRTIVRVRVLENVAARIEQGDMPRVQLREAADTKVEPQHDRERLRTEVRLPFS